MRLEQLWKRASTWVLLVACAVVGFELFRALADMTDAILDRARARSGVNMADAMRRARQFVKPFHDRWRTAADWQQLRRLRNGSAFAPSAAEDLAVLRSVMQPDPDTWLAECAAVAPWLQMPYDNFTGLVAQDAPSWVAAYTVPVLEAEAAAGRWSEAARLLESLAGIRFGGSTPHWDYALPASLQNLLRLRPDAAATVAIGGVVAKYEDSTTSNIAAGDYSQRIARNCLSRLHHDGSGIGCGGLSGWLASRNLWTTDLAVAAEVVACASRLSGMEICYAPGRCVGGGCGVAAALLEWPISRASALQRRLETALQNQPLVLEDMRRAADILGEVNTATALRLLYADFPWWSDPAGPVNLGNLCATERHVLRAACAARLHFLREGAWPETLEAVHNELWPPSSDRPTAAFQTLTEYLAGAAARPWTPIMAGWIAVTPELVASRFGTADYHALVTPAPDTPGEVNVIVTVESVTGWRHAVSVAETAERLYGDALLGRPEIVPRYAPIGEQPPLERQMLLARNAA